jgi:cytoskeletal protein RodZ
MSGEDAPRPYLENLIVLEIKTNKQTRTHAHTHTHTHTHVHTHTHMRAHAYRYRVAWVSVVQCGWSAVLSHLNHRAIQIGQDSHQHHQQQPNFSQQQAATSTTITSASDHTTTTLTPPPPPTAVNIHKTTNAHNPITVIVISTALSNSYT